MKLTITEEHLQKAILAKSDQVNYNQGQDCLLAQAATEQVPDFISCGFDLHLKGNREIKTSAFEKIFSVVKAFDIGRYEDIKLLISLEIGEPIASS